MYFAQRGKAIETGSNREGVYRGHVIYVCEGATSKQVMEEWRLCLRCCLLGALDGGGVLPVSGIAVQGMLSKSSE